MFMEYKQIFQSLFARMTQPARMPIADMDDSGQTGHIGGISMYKWIRIGNGDYESPTK